MTSGHFGIWVPKWSIFGSPGKQGEARELDKMPRAREEILISLDIWANRHYNHNVKSSAAWGGAGSNRHFNHNVKTAAARGMLDPIDITMVM